MMVMLNEPARPMETWMGWDGPPRRGIERRWRWVAALAVVVVMVSSRRRRFGGQIAKSLSNRPASSVQPATQSISQSVSRSVQDRRMHGVAGGPRLWLDADWLAHELAGSSALQQCRSSLAARLAAWSQSRTAHPQHISGQLGG